MIVSDGTVSPAVFFVCIILLRSVLLVSGAGDCSVTAVSAAGSRTLTLICGFSPAVSISTSDVRQRTPTTAAVNRSGFRSILYIPPVVLCVIPARL